METSISAHMKETLTRIEAALLKKRMIMATVESCTGGLLGGVCTSQSGSSTWYKGGIIAYDNAVKTDVLQVDKDVLEKHGAVSGEVALAMAKGGATLIGADCAVSTTGIAGPEGGTASKPVGTVWIATYVKGHARESKAAVHRFHGSRTVVRLAAVEEAVLSLLRHLEGQ